MTQTQYPAKKILSSKTVLISLLIIFILLIGIVIKNSNKEKKNSQRATALENEILTLENKNQELNQLIDFFSEQEFVEKQAREKLGLAKPGEKLVIIPEQDASETESQKNKPMPNIWFEYFFN